MIEITSYAAPMDRGQFFSFENIMPFPSECAPHVFHRSFWTWPQNHEISVDIAIGGWLSAMNSPLIAIVAYASDMDDTEGIEWEYSAISRFDGNISDPDYIEFEDEMISWYNQIVDTLAERDEHMDGLYSAKRFFEESGLQLSR